MLPMGYIFCPTDEELLCYYLYHKITIVGGFIPPIMLPVVDIYTKESSQIWQQCGGVHGQDVHFFICLKKKKSRVVRKVGPNGAIWSGESKATKVFSHNNTLVGDFKRFHYENPKMKKDGDHNTHTHGSCMSTLFTLILYLKELYITLLYCLCFERRS